MNRKELECYVEYFNKQEGQKYPCSNQVVVCGVITSDREKALSIMEKKGAIIKSRYSGFVKGHIEWELNNERWLWKNWNANYRGYRFYKILIDEDADENLLRFATTRASLYCCSMEIF